MQTGDDGSLTPFRISDTRAAGRACKMRIKTGTDYAANDMRDVTTSGSFVPKAPRF